MKTKFFKTLFVLLISLPFGEGWGGVVLSAQNGVTVSNLAVDAGTVTFTVSWKTPMPVAVWSDSVWVFVDYNNAGKMERLPLSAGATLTATSAPGVAEVIPVDGNNKGVWVVGNARTNGSFSATVQLLTATADLYGACVYGSNYPPVGEHTAVSELSFTGTLPYDVVLKDNGGATTTVPVNSSTFTLPAGATVASFTDKTGAPGIFKCIPMSGSIGFMAMPNPVAKGQQVSLDVNVTTSTPSSSAITYTWSVPDFAQNTYTGVPFVTTAPSTPNEYPVTLTARSTGYCDLTKAGTVTVVDCLNPATTFTLSASASGFCVGDAGVTFALSGTESGRSYTLLRGGSSVATLNGTGSAATFSGAFNTAGVYTAQSEADGVYCSVLMSGTPNISANSLPTVPTISQPANVCENGANLVFTITGYSGTPAWTNVGGGTESGLSVTFSSSLTGTKTVQAHTSQTYTNAPTCYSAEVSQSATVTPNPAITIQPEASTTICTNGTVSLSVTASSVTTYQWRKDGVNVTDGTGGTSANYTTAALSGNATYSVVVFNGSCSVTSANALVTVSTPPSAPTGLSSNVPTICSGVETSATLTAAGGSVGSGAVYEWGTGSTVGSSALTTTTGNTYSVSPSAAATYWVRLKGTGACSAATTAGVTTSVATYAAISAGEIISGSTTTTAGTNPNVTIQSEAPALGGSGITYEWRRSGASDKTLDGSNATTYNIGSDDTNYAAAGTYYFNRYAKDAACSNASWVAATGTYTLGVENNGPPGTVTTTLCTQCCYTGSAWVDCYVTTNAVSTSAVWSGNNNTYYSGASGTYSNVNGKNNTDNISSTGTSAVQICKNLGTGWYLPAYEELVNMSAGTSISPLNGKSGASILTGSYHWSSTEYYGNGGRHNTSATSYQTRAVRVNTDGALFGSTKTDAYYVRCAWRN